VAVHEDVDALAGQRPDVLDLELALAAVGLRAIGVTDRMQAGLWAGGTGSEPS
jgi:hypothetical protein